MTCPCLSPNFYYSFCLSILCKSPNSIYEQEIPNHILDIDYYNIHFQNLILHVRETNDSVFLWCKYLSSWSPFSSFPFLQNPCILTPFNPHLIIKINHTQSSHGVGIIILLHINLLNILNIHLIHKKPEYLHFQALAWRPQKPILSFQK